VAKRLSCVPDVSFRLHSRGLPKKEQTRTRGWLLTFIRSVSAIPPPLALICLAVGFGAITLIVKPSILHAARGGVHIAPEDTLIVWAGDQAHVAPDFIAVVDFDEHSSTYGKVLSSVPLPSSLPTSVSGSSGAIGNEPHHLGLSADRKTLALGGLLSVLCGQNQVFFFDVSNPRDPQFIRADNAPASITDEFDSLSNGGFLATFMGSPGGPNVGANPGRLVEYDANQDFVQAWPANPPSDGFDPHGLGIDEAHNLIVTSDFICPLHTLGVAGGEVILRGSIRVWNFPQRSITRQIVVGDPSSPAGTMDVKLIPHDRQLRAFTAGMADNKLYLVDTQAGTATAVYDFSPRFTVPGSSIMPQLLLINHGGTRLFITLNYGGHAGKVVQFDISRPDEPRVLDVVDLGPGSGPHYLGLTSDERRLVVSDYFLVEDLSPGGVVSVDGDHKVHVIKVYGNHLTLDPHFDLDFNRDISTGPARPHGLALLRAQAD
jgi:hypothetical protein